MNFNISEINSWYKTEAGKINKDLVVDSINSIILDHYDRSILYIGPNDIIRKIMKQDKSFNSFFVSTSKYSDIKAEIENLPFQNSSIDLFVLVHSLEINKDPHAVFREINRILKEDGEIIITSFNKMSFIGLFNYLPVDSIFKNKNYIRISRLEDWAKLFSYQINRIMNINKIPPFNNKKILKYLGFLNNTIFSKINFFGNSYILYAKKNTYKFISLKNWHKKNNIILGKFSKPMIHNNYEE